jgi:hypothetical protein
MDKTHDDIIFLKNEILNLNNEIASLKTENTKTKETLENVLIKHDEETIRWILSIVRSNLIPRSNL